MSRKEPKVRIAVPSKEQVMDRVIDNLNREIDTFKHTLEIADRDNDRLSESIKKYEKENDELRKEIKKVSQHNTDLVNRLAQKDVEIATLRGYIQRVNQQDNCAHPVRPNQLIETSVRVPPHFNTPSIHMFDNRPDYPPDCAGTPNRYL